MLSVALLAACGADGPSRARSDTKRDIDVPEPDRPVFGRDERTITIQSHRTFTIALRENPSVGDAWMVRRAPDADVAVVEEDRLDYAETDPKPGTPGARSFVLRAGDHPGRTTLVVKNCYRAVRDCKVRPADERFAEELTFTIVVT